MTLDRLVAFAQNNLAEQGLRLNVVSVNVNIYESCLIYGHIKNSKDSKEGETPGMEDDPEEEYKNKRLDKGPTIE